MTSDEETLDALARVLAPRVAEILRGTDTTLLDQRNSPLGSRRHCAAVRARIRRGELGASVVGRRFYLTRAALDEEIRTIGARVAPKPAPRKETQMEELARRFPLQRAV